MVVFLASWVVVGGGVPIQWTPLNFTYLKVKIDGLSIPKGRWWFQTFLTKYFSKGLVQPPTIKRKVSKGSKNKLKYVGTASPSIFQVDCTLPQFSFFSADDVVASILANCNYEA